MSELQRPLVLLSQLSTRLTAWLGLLLLVAFLVEGATLISLGQLMTVHIVVGVLLVALVLAKTATTGWRIFRYYSGDPAYRVAGPPPLLLRLLGPLVVIGGLAVLGSGLALIALGPSARQSLFSLPGFTTPGQRTMNGIRSDSSYIQRLSYQPRSPRKKPWSDE